MGNDYFAVIIGFIGVLIGSLGSSLMIYIQSKIQDNRERTKLVVNAALEEYKEILNLAKNQPGKHTIMPFTGAIHWYSKIFDMVDKNNFNEKNLKKLFEENNKIIEVFKHKNG